PWVWPVATSTASVMHVMAHDAAKRGARKFGIVWEYTYRFGQEGHDAFVGAVKRIPGATIAVDVKIQGGQTSYSNDVNTFIGGCGGADKLDTPQAKCDFVAMLLEPNTASTWVRDKGLGDPAHPVKYGIGGPQPLFLNSFARDCGADCANMRVWTSFKPPIDPFDTDPAVVTYKNDLRNVSQTADANNPHVEGAYVGMMLVVEALKKLGASPTRIGMQRVLDSMTLDTGLSPTITFSPGHHESHASVQAFEDIVNNGSFSNWRYTRSNFIRDDDLGRDV
ncbi:MAG: ABC transporter substrate-binding protein, partial [Actinomycetota bacterium]